MHQTTQAQARQTAQTALASGHLKKTPPPPPNPNAQRKTRRPLTPQDKQAMKAGRDKARQARIVHLFTQRLIHSPA